MAENPLVQLAESGQSIWYDQMVRSLVTRGTLRELIKRDDLRGLTSNPTIFEKAIGGSSEYDEQLKTLARAGKSRDEIYEELVVDDIGRAADVFREVYDRTDGHDGYVSLEVSPTLAHDTEATIADGRRLFARVGRPNVMIKVPATPEGLPAIRTLIADGINVNVTLIFSRAVYAQVIDAYISGIGDRVRAGKPVDRVASVASFFVSRIDSAADKQLESKINAAGAAERQELSKLLGKTAIANAKLAYALFKEKFSSAEFDALRRKGARPQRALWASTGTKNAAYSDVLYVDELIGPDTVNTVPPQTYDAFRDHGRVRPTLEEHVAGAKATLDSLERAGVSLDAITRQLTIEGVKSFADSFLSLMETIEARRDAVLRDDAGRESYRLGKHQPEVNAALAKIDAEKTVARIWKKDVAVWKTETAHVKIIANSLGWLRVVGTMRGQVSDLNAFAEEVRAEFDHVVVLGMGGSSLCSEVLRTSFGQRAGYPRLHVLDSTVPATVKALERRLDKKKTLFIVASKSGTTTEPVMFHQYFYGRMKAVRGNDAGRAFIAITDPETQLARDAERDGFRRTFINPADIGGRYSALSLFGLVPAALAGVDVAAFLDRAGHAMHVCSPHLAARENPGARLGATLAALAAGGRDK
ncbi:MAG: bifunctional transaldolase/phosoglucose isomerase, partial [Thermoanaerobaculia bacterium]